MKEINESEILLCKIILPCKKEVSRECRDILQTGNKFHKKHQMKNIFKYLNRSLKITVR